jgi:response regulator of citrate/malate metabolism
VKHFCQDNAISQQNLDNITELISKLPEDEIILDGFKFKGINDIAQDKMVKKIRNTEEMNDESSLNRTIEAIKRSRPQLIEYYIKNQERLKNFYNNKTGNLTE